MSGAGTGTPSSAPVGEPTLADMILEVQTRLGDAEGAKYSTEMVRLMINSGLSFLFPKFYAVEALQLTGNGSTKVFELEPVVGEEVGGILDVYETGG